MGTETMTPLEDLVPSSKSYFTSIVQPAIERAISSPENGSQALAAIILLYHIKDWAKCEGFIQSEQEVLNECPFAGIIGSLANGGKHSTISNKRWVNPPYILGFRVCGFGQGGYGVGPYGRSNIQVKGLRTRDEPPRWHSLKSVLTQARDWWAIKLEV